MHIAVILHTISIVVAFLFSFFIFFAKKGTKSHRVLGWIFVILMLIGSISSFWIKSSGDFSIIHILSIAVIYWLIMGVLAIRRKKFNWQYSHVRNMGSAYIAILIAGAGVIVRHYVFPGDVAMGGIASLITAIVAIAILIKTISKYKLPLKE